MSRALALGLDVSTTAAKAIAVDAEGRVVAQGSASFPLENPSPGAWEQDARAWRDAAFSAIAGATAELGEARRRDVRAIAIAHQRETFVVTDEHGEPLAPAIVWMDSRSKQEVRDACSELDERRILELSGKVPCTTPSLYKIRMLLTRLSPELGARRDKKVADVHGFVVKALTGQWRTSTAATDPLGIVDMRARDYAAELLDLARLRRGEVLDLVEPGAPIAPVLPEVAARLGLDQGVVVVGGAGDGQAAGLGAGAIAAGSAYLNIGTAIVTGVPSRDYRVSRSFRTLFGAVPGTYLFESDLKGGTLTLDWLADRLLGQGRFEKTSARMATLSALEEKASRLSPGAGGLMALPYWAGVMNPHWDDDAGGALIGVRADHGPEHLYRAICEGLAFEHRMIFELIERETIPIRSIVAVGGATKSPFLLGLFATALGRELVRSTVDETTALGAALLAAPAAGLAASIEDAVTAMVETMPGRAPGAEASRYTQLYEGAYRGLYEALAPALKVLSR